MEKMPHFNHFNHSKKNFNHGMQEVVANSPWGAIAGFFLLQPYGFILLNGLFFAARFSFEFFWLLFWILAMLILQASFLTKIRTFLKEQKIKDYFLVLKEPLEIFKFFIAILTLSIFILFNLGYYPFPTSDRPLIIGIGVELVISLSLSFYLKNATEMKAQKDKKIIFLGLIILLIYTCVPLFQKFPTEIIYFTTIPGLGMILFILTQLLIEKKRK